MASTDERLTLLQTSLDRTLTELEGLRKQNRTLEKQLTSYKYAKLETRVDQLERIITAALGEFVEDVMRDVEENDADA